MTHLIYGLDALRIIEQRAATQGIDLMIQAAHACAHWVSQHYAAGARILVAAGPGHNGSDALIAADLLDTADFIVDVLLPQTPKRELAQQAHEKWLARSRPSYATLPDAYPRPDLIIDGLFGIGLTRPLDAFWAQHIATLNALQAPILALDTPSGLDPYTGVPQHPVICAQTTLTFICHKPGLWGGAGADMAGQIVFAPLNGIDDSDLNAEGELAHPSADALQRPRNSHKGSYGTVGIVGGQAGMIGAALLAGRAALYAGAGKVRVLILDPSVTFDGEVPELMFWPTPTLPPDCQVLAIGPGLGVGNEAVNLLQNAIATAESLVIDADALNLLALQPSLAEQLAQRLAPTILTPHPAEAARLLKSTTAKVQNHRIHAARTLALQFNAIVVLKGVGSLIVPPQGRYILNPTGGPALASAGQGDVLTGLIAALLSQKLSPLHAATLAVYVHGLIADDYQTQQGGPLGLSATSTIKRLAPTLNRLIRKNNHA